MKIYKIANDYYFRASEVPTWLEEVAIGAEAALCLQTARNLRNYAGYLRKFILDQIDKM